MRLAISLLGPIRVTLNGYIVDRLNVEAAQALLAYLAMTPETVYDRETLAALLWSDRSRADGLRNLRQTL